MNLIDRRTFKRYKKETTFQLKIKTVVYNCRTIDYSADGICMQVFGKDLPLLPGDRIAFTVEDPELKFQGEVAWINESDYGYKLGCKRSGNLKGTCGDFQMSDIMIGLQRTMRTGVLEIIQGTKVTKVYIRNGDFVFANSNQEDDRLGEFLLKQGTINLNQFIQARDRIQKTGKKLGKILVELGYLKPADLFRVIRQQVENIILGIVTVECGSFEFREGPLPTEETVTLNLSAANLIYKGIKGMNNFQYLLEDLPPLNTVLCISQNTTDFFQDISMDNHDKVILSAVNGKNTIEKILSGSSIQDFEIVKSIYALLCARIIAIKEDDSPQEITPDEVIRESQEDVPDETIRKPQEAAPDEAVRKSQEESDSGFIDVINELYDIYKSRGFYDILGVDEKAEDRDIKSAYLEKSREFHPDRHFACESDDAKKKLTDIFTYINLAYDTLSNPEKRRQYNKLRSKQPAQEASNTKIASQLYQEGKALLADVNLYMQFNEGEEQKMVGNLMKAKKVFSEAIYFDSSEAEYHYYYGMVLSRLKVFREAVKVLNKAIEMDPSRSVYLAELGHVLLNLDFRKRAQSAFSKALKIDPSDPRAREGMRMLKVP
jgi:curved DNA-binding protein CbpA